MKKPAEYLAAAKATVPQAEPDTHALLAIDLALADAERYKNNVVGAVLRSHPVTTQAAAATPSDEF